MYVEYYKICIEILYCTTTLLARISIAVAFAFAFVFVNK